MNNKGVLSLARNTLFLTVSHGGAGLTRALYAFLLASFLGPAIYGSYAYGQFWYLTFLPLTLQAADSSLAIIIATRSEDWRKQVYQRLSLRSGASILAAVLCGVLGLIFAPDKELASLLPLFALALVGRGIALWVNAVFIAHENSPYVMRLELGFRLFELILGSIWIINGGSLLGVILLHISTWWLQCILGLYFIREELGQLTWQRPKLDSALKDQLILVIAGISGAWIMMGPLILYRQFSSALDEIGQFALLMQLFIFLAGIPWAVSQAVLPPLSRAIKNQNGKARLYAEAVPRFSLLLGAFAAMGSHSLASPVFDWLLDGKYSIASQYLGWMILSIIPVSISLGLAQLLISSHRFKIYLLTTVIGSLALTLSMPWLVKNYGLAGALGATALGFIGWSGSQWFFHARRQQLNWHFALLRPFAAVCVSLGLYALLLSIEVPITAFILSTATLFIISILFGAISHNERQLLAKFLSLKSVITRD